MELDWFEVGARISSQRNKLGLKQQDIYETMSISQNHYSRIENGHVGISIEKLIQLSDILNISIDYILTGKIPRCNKTDFEKKYSELTNKQKKYIDQQIDCLKKFNLR